VNKHGEQWRLISKTYFDSARSKDALRLRYSKLIPQTQEERATKSKSKHLWTCEQEQTLLQAVNKHGGQWRLISKKYFDSARTKAALKLKYNRLISQTQEDRAIKSKSKYNLWTYEQEQTLLQAVKKHGQKWRFISKTYFDSIRTKNALQSRYKNLICWSQEDDDVLKKVMTKLSAREGEMFLKLIKEKDSYQVISRWKLLNNIHDESKESNVPNDINEIANKIPARVSDEMINRKKNILKESKVENTLNILKGDKVKLGNREVLSQHSQFYDKNYEIYKIDEKEVYLLLKKL
ncbi:9062_t:CDS:1, partial [Diversispora eburnea]